MNRIQPQRRSLRCIALAGLLAVAMIGAAACGSTSGVGSASTSTAAAVTGSAGTVEIASAHSSETAVTSPSELTATPRTPSASPVAKLTPDADGLYRQVSVAQARQLTPFPISVPASSSLPKSLTFEGINASARPQVIPGSPISHGWGPVQMVDLFYIAADGSRGYGAQITEFGHSFDSAAVPEATPSTLTINGHSVAKNRVVRPKQDGVSYTSYVWNNGKTYFLAEATFSDQFTEKDFEAMIASTLGQ